MRKFRTQPIPLPKSAIFFALSIISGLFIGVSAQATVDKAVATVSDGVRTELITLSDLRWQLALQPGTSLRPITTADLNTALRLVIDQRIFALEAKRLPSNPVTEAEIDAKIKDIMARFSTAAEFESRLRVVGFTSIRDDNFERIIADRVAIDKYLDFRFRSFVVITPEDEERYFREVYAPDFRRRYPGLLMPTLQDKRAEINRQLTEDRISAEMLAFLDAARQRVTIVYLSEV